MRSGLWQGVPTVRGSTAMRRLALSLALSAAILGCISFIDNESALAACTPGQPVPGTPPFNLTPVDCTGVTVNQNAPNGFGDGTLTGIAVTVQAGATLTGTDRGISLDTENSLTNRGTIAGGQTGVRGRTFTFVANQASGVITGATGVLAEVMVLRNDGRIEATGDAVHHGIGLVNGAFSGTTSIENGGRITGQRGIFSQGFGALFITNRGTISGSDLAGGVGISTVEFGPSNDSTGRVDIENVAGATISGAIGVRMGERANLINAGTIRGVGGTAIEFTDFNNMLTIAPTSVIVGNVVTPGVGSNRFNLGGTGTGSFDLAEFGDNEKYRGFDFFEKIGSSTWTITGASNDGDGVTWIVRDGTLRIDATTAVEFVDIFGGTLTGVAGPLGPFEDRAVRVRANGTFAPGGSVGAIGTINLNQMEFLAGSSLAIDISPTDSDRVTVRGIATLNGAVIVSSVGGTYTAGDYTVLTATRPLIGTFQTVLPAGDFSGLVPTLVYTTNSVILRLEAGSASGPCSITNTLPDARPGTLRQCVVIANANPNVNDVLSQLTAPNNVIALNSADDPVRVTQTVTLDGASPFTITNADTNFARPLLEVANGATLTVGDNVTLDAGPGLQDGFDQGFVTVELVGAGNTLVVQGTIDGRNAGAVRVSGNDNRIEISGNVAVERAPAIQLQLVGGSRASNTEIDVSGTIAVRAPDDNDIFTPAGSAIGGFSDNARISISGTITLDGDTSAVSLLGNGNEVTLSGTVSTIAGRTSGINTNAVTVTATGEITVVRTAIGARLVTIAAGGRVVSTGAGAETINVSTSGGRVVLAGHVGATGANAVAVMFEERDGLTLELHPTYSLVGSVRASDSPSSRSENNIFALGGPGVGTFNTTEIGGPRFDGNFGVFEKTGISTWTITGNRPDLAWTVREGTLIVDDVAGAMTLAGGTLGGNGTVGSTIVNSGRLAAGESIGTLNINGNLTFGAGGTLAVEVSTAAADLISVTGTATLAGMVSLTDLGGGTYTAGQQFTLLTAAGGRTGTFTLVPTLIGSFAAELSYTANSVLLTLVDMVSPGRDAVWDGSASTDWFTASNWQSNALPRTVDDVTINTVTPNPTVIGSSGAASHDIDIGTAAGTTGNLTIQGGGTLGTSGAALIGANGGTGTVAVSGAGASWIVTGAFQIGSTAGGGPSGIGNLIIDNGGSVTAIGAAFFGGNSGSRVSVTGSGSVWNIGGNLTVNPAADNSITIAGGGRINVANGAGTVFLGSGADASTLIIGGAGAAPGTLDAAAVVLGPAASIVFDHNAANYVFAPAISSQGVPAGTAVFVQGGTTIFTADNTYAGATVVEGTGVRLQLGNGGTTGSVSGDVEVRLDATLAFNRSNTLTFNGMLSGDGKFVQAGTGTTVLAANNATFTGTTSIDAGILRVNGSLGGTVQVNSGGTLGGTGTVGTTIVGAGGKVEAGNSIGTLAVAGNISFAAGSTYQVEVNAVGAADRLAVTGTATLSGAGVAVLAEAGSYALSTTYTILKATGGIVGTFATATSNFAFLLPTLSYSADTVTLTLDRNGIDFASIGGTFNQRSTGAAVQVLGAGNAVFDAVVVLDIPGARAAFDKLSGEVHASVAGMLADDSHFVRDAASDRIRSAFGDASSSEPPVMAYGPTGAHFVDPDDPLDVERFSVWTQAYGSWGNRGSDGNAADFERSLGGLLIGGDTMVTDAVRFGFVGGFGRSSFESPVCGSSGNVGSWHAGVYGGGHWDGFTLTGGATYSWHNISTRRSVVFPGFADTLTARYGAGAFQAFGEAGYAFETGSAEFTPFASLAHVSVRTSGFTETGMAAALTSAGSSTDVTFTTVGIRAAADLPLGGVKATLSGMVGWRHAFGDVTPSASFAFAGGGPFTILGTPLARDAAVVEAGLGLQLSPNADLNLSFAGQFGSKTVDYGATARFSLKF